MYKYPYGDSQQLNLDWILAKLKELETADLGLDLEKVSNALISLTYNTSTAYRRYDYAFLNGKLYRCLTDTTGAFDPAAWQEALIGDDLAVLTRWINAIDAAAVVDVKFDTSGTNGKIQQKYHDQYHDVVEVDYTPLQNSKRPLSSNAGYELNGAISEINSHETLPSGTWSFYGSGFITNGGKDIRFIAPVGAFTPTQQQIKNVVTTVSTSLRLPTGGYVYDGTGSLSGGNFNATEYKGSIYLQAYGRGIYIMLYREEGWVDSSTGNTIANNTIIGGAISLTLTQEIPI